MCTYDVCTWVHMCIVHVCVYEYRHAGVMVCLYMSGYWAQELQGILLSHHRSTEITTPCPDFHEFWCSRLRTSHLTSQCFMCRAFPEPKNLSLIKSSVFVFQVTAKLMRFYLWVRKGWGVGVFNKQLKDQHIIQSSFCMWLQWFKQKIILGELQSANHLQKIKWPAGRAASTYILRGWSNCTAGNQRCMKSPPSFGFFT